jgi:hypothetical protein
MVARVARAVDMVVREAKEATTMNQNRNRNQNLTGQNLTGQNPSLNPTGLNLR